jgi:hypothetical protein
LLEGDSDVWAVQELLSHIDVKTTMIYTHVLNRGGKGVKSPWTFLRETAKCVFTETIYHPNQDTTGVLISCKNRGYGDFGPGALCRNFAAQGRYRETI